jgi:hypothetical protein
MKKKYLFGILLAGLALSINAQITMTCKTHGLMVGDSHDFIIAQNVEEGISGANVLWDFSNLTPTDRTLTSHMLNPLNTEKGSAIPAANTVLEEYGNQFYFNVNKNKIEQYGTVSCNTVVKYSKPFVKIKYPFTYSDHVSGTYEGVQESAGNSIPVSGTYDILGDAYGTLLLPGNITIDNVLRVKQTRTINNNGSVSTEITYRWYSANIRYPVLVIIQYVTPEKAVTTQVAYYAHAENTKSTPLETPTITNTINDLTISPNPCNNEAIVRYNLATTGKVRIELFDASGRMIETLLSSVKQNAGYHDLTINSNKNGAGIYYVRLTTNGYSTTSKLVKQ